MLYCAWRYVSYFIRIYFIVVYVTSEWPVMSALSYNICYFTVML